MNKQERLVLLIKTARVIALADIILTDIKLQEHKTDADVMRQRKTLEILHETTHVMTELVLLDNIGEEYYKENDGERFNYIIGLLKGYQDNFDNTLDTLREFLNEMDINSRKYLV